MNETVHRIWPVGSVGVLALLYVWIGVVAGGGDAVLGIAGGVAVLGALAVASRSRMAAIGLLVLGTVPLAAATWWSLVTPVVGLITLLLGWFAVRNVSQATTHRPTLELAS